MNRMHKAGLMTPKRDKKTWRTYDLKQNGLDALDRLSGKGFIKEKVVNAGVLLFEAAPPAVAEVTSDG